MPVGEGATSAVVGGRPAVARDPSRPTLRPGSTGDLKGGLLAGCDVLMVVVGASDWRRGGGGGWSFAGSFDWMKQRSRVK